MDLKIYFYFLRCDTCTDLREDWNKLLEKLNEMNIGDIVIGEADCCQESDLCSSSDRKTSCILNDFVQGNLNFWN